MTVTLIAALPMSVPIAPLLVSGDVCRAFTACALLALMMVLFARVVRRHLAAERRRGWWELGGLVVGGLAPWPFLGDGWLHASSFVVAAVTVVLRLGLSVALAAGAVTGAVLLAALGDHHRAQHHLGANLVVAPILTTGVLHYARRIADLRAARAERARAAVARDRRRVARELHDLLSHTLTAIRLKADLAMVVADVDRARARAAVDELIAIANTARRDTGDAVVAHISLDATEELAAAVALLELSGVRCAVNAAADGLPAPVSDALGWILREAATNVIKHGTAANCFIDLVRDSGRIVLRVHNDGVTRRGERWGAGLHGVRERVEALGGAMSADGDERSGFTLLVELGGHRDPRPAG